MRLTKLRRIRTSIDSIGDCNIVLTFICIASLTGDVFAPNRHSHLNPSVSLLVIGLWFFTWLLYGAWKCSTARFRTPIVLLMFLDTFLNFMGMEQFTQSTYVAVDILWLIGLYLMYTGPSLREVIRQYRVSAYQM